MVLKRFCILEALLVLLVRQHQVDAFSPRLAIPARKPLLIPSSNPASPISSKDSCVSFQTKPCLSVVAATADGSSEKEKNLTLRARLRQVTGFSFTALRTTLRTMTGISLTALWVGAVTFTSVGIRNFMKLILKPIPTWFRYFLQPFLILYYVPLIAVREMAGPARKEKLAAHEAFVDHLKEAVKAADEAQHGGYWPVHVNEDGVIVQAPPDPKDGSVVDITDAVAESVEVSFSEREGEKE